MMVLAKYEVWCEQGGLMEDPDFHWEPMFRTNNPDLVDACVEKARKDYKFAKQLMVRGNRCSYWSWRLAFRHDVFKEGM